MDKWNRDKKKGVDSLSETATKSAPKPGNYPVGSLQSRAAARALIQRRDNEDLFIQIVYDGPSGATTLGPRIRVPRT